MENELPKRKSLIWVFLSLGIVLIIAIACYFTVFNSSKNYYKRVVGSTLDSVLSESLKMYDNNQKTNTSLKISSNIELDNQILDQKILDIINNLVLGFNVQTDTNNKKVALNLDTKYQNEDLLKASIIQNDSNIYMYSKDILGDKYIKIDESDFDESFDVPSITIGQKLNYNTAKKEIIKEAKKTIKDKYCSKKTQGMNNIYTFKISEKDFVVELQNVFKNLSENKNFINSFEDEADILNTLIESYESLEETKNEANENVILSLDVEASCLTQKPVRFVISELENEVVTSQINIENNENIYTYQLKNNYAEILNGQVGIEKNKENVKYVIKVVVPELGKITINLEVASSNDVSIPNINVSNVTDINALTESDMSQISERIENSNISKFVEDLMDVLSLFGMDLNEESTNNFEFDTLDYDGFLLNQSEENNNEINFENSIITYDGNIVVEYNAPTGYELSDFSSKNYKNYSKEGIDIKVSSYYSTVEEYLAKLDERATYYTSENNWNNVKLSDKKEIKAGNRTCYYRELSANYGSGEYANYNATVYACTKLDDEHIYVVEIDTVGEEIPMEILNTLFYINVK